MRRKKWQSRKQMKVGQKIRWKLVAMGWMQVE